MGSPVASVAEGGYNGDERPRVRGVKWGRGAVGEREEAENLRKGFSKGSDTCTCWGCYPARRRSVCEGKVDPIVLHGGTSMVRRILMHTFRRVEIRNH